MVSLPTDISVNQYRKANPLTGIISKNILLTKSDEEVYHIEIDLKSSFNYYEGQSLGVLTPGTTPAGKTHAVRLYSIASVKNKNPIELCIKKVVYPDSETSELQYGVASNYICNLKPGEEIQLTGPAGRKFVLPENYNYPYIFFATGTGIAPFKGMLQTLLIDNNQLDHPIYLFFGVKTKKDLLYHEEFIELTSKFKNFHYITALSREEKTIDNKKVYISSKFKDLKSEITPILQSALIYICGLKGMETDIYASIANMLNTNIASQDFENWKSEHIFKEVY